MPGARPRGFRLGDRAELLAEYILNTKAFKTRVPRQEYIGHDFLCVLSEQRDDLIWAGPSFTVQVKSNRDPLIFEKRHELRWIGEIDTPFFIAVINREELLMDLYSTWKRLNGILHKGARRILLIPGEHTAQYEGVTTEEDGSEQRIPLGRPIISTTLPEMMNEMRVNEYSEVLRNWIELDRDNIVRCRAGMYWVLGPKWYRTNDRISPEEVVGFFYWNPRNLEICQKTFGRAATALRTVLRAALGEEGEKDNQFVQQIRDLDQVLKSHASCLDPLATKVLNEYVKIDI